MGAPQAEGVHLLWRILPGLITALRHVFSEPTTVPVMLLLLLLWGARSELVLCLLLLPIISLIIGIIRMLLESLRELLADLRQTYAQRQAQAAAAPGGAVILHAPADDALTLDCKQSEQTCSTQYGSLWANVLPVWLSSLIWRESQEGLSYTQTVLNHDGIRHLLLHAGFFGRCSLKSEKVVLKCSFLR